MESDKFSLEKLKVFISKIKGFKEAKSTRKIEWFIYFLTIENGFEAVSAIQVRECFLELRINPYSNISAYLNSNLKGKGKVPPKFLRTKVGYQLHRNLQEEINNSLAVNVQKVAISNNLRMVLNHVKSSNENEFLKEAINCFEVSAYRAAIIMVWNLSIDHLYEHIFKFHINDFNSVLAKNTDKRVKIGFIKTKDDFSEIPEGKFIEFCKSANIISNDVRKILDIKLGIRNTYAHPSNVKLNESKALEFIEDLINNVVVKYNISSN